MAAAMTLIVLGGGWASWQLAGPSAPRDETEASARTASAQRSPAETARDRGFESVDPGTDRPMAARVAVDDPPNPSSESSPPGTPHLVDEVVLRGLVVDLHDAPVPDVKLVHSSTAQPPAAPRPSKTVVTDPTGSFALPIGGLSGGRLHVVDEHWVGVFQPRLYVDRESPPPLTVVVAPARQLAGRVVDADTGVPLTEVQLRITAVGPSRADFDRDLSLSRPATWETVTDQAGRFEIRAPDLPALGLHATREGYEELRSPVTAPPTVLRLAMHRSRSLLRGTVLDARGEPAAGAVVLCTSASAVADAAGEFVLDLAEVRARQDSDLHRLLIATRPGELPGLAVGPELAWREASAWPSPLMIRLGEPGLSISGTVVEADGTPVEGIQVRILDEQPIGHGLSGSFDSPRSLEGLARTHVSREGDDTIFEETPTQFAPGTFQIGGLQRRAYRLRIEDHRRLRALTTDPVAAGSTGLQLRLPAEPMWESVGGVVTDRQQRPVLRAWIRIVREFQHGPDRFLLTLSCGSDEEGRFRTETPVAAQGTTTLLVQHPRLEEPTRLDLSAQADPGNLRVAVPSPVRARVLSTPLSRTVARVRFLDATGRPVTLRVIGEPDHEGRRAIDLVDGHSPTFQLPDTATTAVLQLDDGTEFRRQVDWSDDLAMPVHDLAF
jgi:hypothetical protein